MSIFLILFLFPPPRPKQKSCVVRVPRPYLQFWSRPYFFFQLSRIIFPKTGIKSGKYQSRFLSPIVILFPVIYFISKWWRQSKVFLPFSDQFNSSVYKPGALKPTERQNRAKRKYSTTWVTNPKSAAVDLRLSETQANSNLFWST